MSAEPVLTGRLRRRARHHFGCAWEWDLLVDGRGFSESGENYGTGYSAYRWLAVCHLRRAARRVRKGLVTYEPEEITL